MFHSFQDFSKRDGCARFFLESKRELPFYHNELIKSVGATVRLGYECSVCLLKGAVWRKCGLVVRALALRSGYRGLKTRSDHGLNFFLVLPGSTSQLHLT